MSLNSGSLRRFVRRTLVDTTAATIPGHAPLATAFNILCDRLRERLQPLFGRQAVMALFARSVHLATEEFPWLAEVVGRAQDPCAVDGLSTLNRLDKATVEDGFAAVLAHNIGLLSAFVGDDLVLPLVQQAWGVSGVSGSERDQ